MKKRVRITGCSPKGQNGLDMLNVQQPAELEAGEVYQDTEGGINKIKDSAPVHENGGVLVDDVDRVLEDTSDKREDFVSKELKLDPDEVENLTGWRPKRALTHSKAFEASVEYWNNKYKALENKVKINLENAKESNSIYAKNALDMNTAQLQAIPTKEQLFNSLFDYQEQKKEMMGAEEPTEKFTIGGNAKVIYKKNDEYDDEELIPTGDTTIVKEGDKKKKVIVSSNKDKFNEPLRWYDVAGALDNLINSDRIPVNYDAPEITYSQPKYINPTPQLQNATASYNAMLERLPQNGVGYANMANLFSSKYNADNQVLGQTENANNQIYNNWMQYEDKMRNAQSANDYNARQNFERKYLTSLEKQRQQKALSKGDLYNTLAQNRKLNREGDLVMSMFNFYDQYGNYNNNPFNFTRQAPSTNIITDAKGRKYYINPETKVTTPLK